MGVTGHSWDVVGYAKSGIDGIEHIWSVGYSSILDLNKRNKLAVDRTAGRIDAEEAGAFYEVEGFDTVIKALTDNKVAWTPTIAKWLRPLSPSAERFWKREQEILANPKAKFPAAVRVVTEFTTEKLFKRYKPDQLERAKVGYQKANEFIRRFVAAGGILKEGSDSPRGMAVLLAPKFMQVASAFAIVQSALNWFVENYPRLAEWAASARRVASLELSLDALDRAESRRAGRIKHGEGKHAALRLHDVSVMLHDGTLIIDITMRIFSSAAWCFRVARRMLRTSASDDAGVELDFCLIFAP